MARVLVADDDAMSRRFLAKILAADGHEVIQARDGGHAWGEISADGFELLLLNVTMPVATGVELCAMVRNRGSYLRRKVFLFSADPSIDIRQAAIEAGADEFFVTPFRREVLVLSVRRAIEARDSCRAPRHRGTRQMTAPEQCVNIEPRARRRADQPRSS